jgi:hypothetical protein
MALALCAERARLRGGVLHNESEEFICRIIALIHPLDEVQGLV